MYVPGLFPVKRAAASAWRQVRHGPAAVALVQDAEEARMTIGWTLTRILLLAAAVVFAGAIF